MLTECSFNDLSDMANSFIASREELEAIEQLPNYRGRTSEFSYSFDTAAEAIAEAKIIGPEVNVGFTYSVDEYNESYAVTICY